MTLPAWLPVKGHIRFRDPPCPGGQVGMGVNPTRHVYGDYKLNDFRTQPQSELVPVEKRQHFNPAGIAIKQCQHLRVVTHKTLRPATLPEFQHRQSILKLNSIHCHSAPHQLFSGGHFTVRQGQQTAQQMSLADVHC